MKVLFIDSVHAFLKNEMVNYGLKCVDATTWQKEKIFNEISDFDGIVIRSKFPVDRHFLEKAEKLKFIARSGSGLENVDVEFAKSKGIVCFNSPEGNKDAVGEHLVGMLLALFNHLASVQTEIKNGFWKREQNRGLELMGKTVGLIGYGNNGAAFAKKLSGFDCKILAYDKYKDNFGNHFVTETSLKEIKKQADILSFHVPYNQETHYYFNFKFLNEMEKPFFILNASRGKVLETKALIDGLQNKKILGACLDVLEYERPSFEDFMTNNPPADFAYLVQAKNVLLSPHVAGWTQESYVRLSEVLWHKIKHWLSKQHLS